MKQEKKADSGSLEKKMETLIQKLDREKEALNKILKHSQPVKEEQTIKSNKS